VLGGIFFLIKVVLHVVIKLAKDQEFHFGSFGYVSNPIFLLPIWDEFPKDSSGWWIKIIGNIMYVLSLLLWVIFLVGSNL